MPRKLYKDQQGFTIIELLIATTVFSVLLVGILASFVKISDLYFKGVSMSKTQEDARNIVQSITDDIQFGASVPSNVDAANVDEGHSPTTGLFCIANHRYAYQIGDLVDGSQSHYGLARENISGCPTTPFDPTHAQNLVYMLDPGMQLNSLNVDCINSRCNIKIHSIFYGGTPNGLFLSPNLSAQFPTHPEQAPDAQCVGSIESAELCATVDYYSNVLERVL